MDDFDPNPPPYEEQSKISEDNVKQADPPSYSENFDPIRLLQLNVDVQDNAQEVLPVQQAPVLEPFYLQGILTDTIFYISVCLTLSIIMLVFYLNTNYLLFLLGFIVSIIITLYRLYLHFVL